MAAIDPIHRQLTARIASASRWGRPEEVEQLKREQREAMLERHIIEAVSTWPPLTSEQRSRLATLLGPGGESR